MSTTWGTVRRISSYLAVAVLVAALFAAVGGSGAQATHEPANKTSVAGSTIEVTEPGERQLLLTDEIRTSKPTDLILAVTAECSIATDVTTVGNDSESAEGVVEVWVEIDGTPVSVDGSDDGRVVFCNQAYHRTTSMFDDEDATIRTFLRTRQANGFNWMALDVGSGVHTIAVYATLTETATNENTADAAVGKRTLIIEPTKSANDETVTSIG